MTSLAAPPRTGRPAKPAPPWGTWAGIAVAAAVTIWAGTGIGFTLAPLFTDFARGWIVVQDFLNPNWGFIFQVGN
ncbi:MAG TPA: hypothetical protein DEA59_06750, partial [Microbacterium sp.]|nr:hypothetical protein [Microbacterium sp.]